MEVTLDNVASLTMDVLKEWLRGRGLAVSGRKAELVERVQSQLVAEATGGDGGAGAAPPPAAKRGRR